jgi:asparagine synthase (glutamine-hydrolysing)
MVASIAHRGPDGQGLLTEGHAALGHARLAIIDLDQGAQPMRAARAPVSIVFNGEIYNYRALRRELELRGHVFRTHSDTEVILETYLAYGWQGFARMRGMYAFALWDAAAATGLLARDPLGIKPLFLRSLPGGDLAFASEAKALLAHEGGRGRLDEAALHLLLNFRYLPGRRSLFRDIEQLPPGRVLRWRPEGGPVEHPLAEPSQAPVAEPLAALRDSVDAHLTADVEVGAYLSGGIDSAAVVALARERTRGPLRTFTLRVGDDPREAQNAARSAELLGVSNLQADLDPGAAAGLPRLIWHLEVPKVNALQVSELARFTARHVKVVMSGLGGDELFLGYNLHRWLHLAQRTARLTPALVRRGAGALGGLPAVCGPGWSEQRRLALVVDALGDWPRVYGLLRNLWDGPAMRRSLYGPRLLDAGLPDAFEVLRCAWPAGPDPVVAAASYEWREKMVNDLLWHEDRCSMAHGLEVRVPFLDLPLARSVAALSRATLMPRGRPKGYMRRLLRPLLPPAVMRRPKSGFQVHAPRFFRDHLGGLADRLLDPARVRELGLFNPAFVRAVRGAGHRSGLRWHYFLLYLMLGAQLWVEMFEQGEVPSG